MWGAAFSDDGSRIVTGSEDNTVRVWNGRTGECLREIKVHACYEPTMAVSGDARRIVIASDEEARVWDTTTGECLHVYEGNADVQALAAELPFVALGQSLETAVLEATCRLPIAWLADRLTKIVTLPSGRAWAGGAGEHTHVEVLECGNPVEAAP